MKKFLLLFTLMLLVFNYSYSVSKIMPENDWKVKKLKGKVKTMVSKIDEYDYSGKVRAKIEIVTNFNESGYITEEVNYYNGDKKQTITNKYNKDGLLIESKEVPGRKWEHTYKYDKNGKLLRIDDTKASANREYIVITFENFKDSKYVKTVEVNRIQAFKTCYDKDGNEIEWAWITYSPEEQIQTFILYSGIKKDKYGNLIEKTGKYLEITDGGKKLGKETGVIAEEMKIEYRYYE